jgi:hypothetical protein
MITLFKRDIVAIHDKLNILIDLHTKEIDILKEKVEHITVLMASNNIKKKY